MTDVEVIIAEGLAVQLPLDAERIKRYACDILSSNGAGEADVNVIFVDDAAMSGLNERYRDRRGATDVLSFRLSDEASDILEGEVYVSLERAERQAGDYGLPFPEEVVRLVTHGLLHLAGRVHDTEEDSKAMSLLTEACVASFFDDGDTG